MREPHKQISPWLLNEESRVVFIIFSQLQSEKITTGFLPPNSSDSFLNIGAATLAICRPVTVPPVNEIAFISGLETMALPALPPSPCRILNTPFGKPISTQSCESI